MALLSSTASAQTLHTLDGRPISADEIQTQPGPLLSAGHGEGLGLALIRDR
jgi:hypothetical protein